MAVFPHLALAALLSVPAASSPHAANTAWLTDLTAARAKARETGKPLFVDLYAEWCGWCKVLDAKVFSTPQFAEYGKQFVLLRVDTEDGGDGTALYQRFGAGTLPTTLLLRHDLVKIGEIPGYAPLEEFLERTDEQLAMWRKMESAYDSFVAGNPIEDPRGLAEAFHERGDGPRAAKLYRRLLDDPAIDAELASWTRYLLADSLRLAGDYPAAERELGAARSAATGAKAARLLERIDLLSAQLAEDRGDCRAQATALRSFLEQHPNSDQAWRARRTLDTIRTEPRCS
jgi:thioredoxin-like negative regulator of GroEL